MKSTEFDMAHLSAIQGPNYSLHILESEDEVNQGCYMIIVMASALSGEQECRGTCKGAYSI